MSPLNIAVILAVSVASSVYSTTPFTTVDEAQAALVDRKAELKVSTSVLAVIKPFTPKIVDACKTRNANAAEDECYSNFVQLYNRFANVQERRIAGIDEELQEVRKLCGRGRCAEQVNWAEQAMLKEKEDWTAAGRAIGSLEASLKTPAKPISERLSEFKSAILPDYTATLPKTVNLSFKQAMGDLDQYSKFTRKFKAWVIGATIFESEITSSGLDAKDFVTAKIFDTLERINVPAKRFGITPIESKMNMWFLDSKSSDSQANARTFMQNFEDYVREYGNATSEPEMKLRREVVEYMVDVNNSYPTPQLYDSHIKRLERVVEGLILALNNDELVSNDLVTAAVKKWLMAKQMFEENGWKSTSPAMKFGRLTMVASEEPETPGTLVASAPVDAAAEVAVKRALVDYKAELKVSPKMLEVFGNFIPANWKAICVDRTVVATNPKDQCVVAYNDMADFYAKGPATIKRLLANQEGDLRVLCRSQTGDEQCKAVEEGALKAIKAEGEDLEFGAVSPPTKENFIKGRENASNISRISALKTAFTNWYNGVSTALASSPMDAVFRKVRDREAMIRVAKTWAMAANVFAKEDAQAKEFVKPDFKTELAKLNVPAGRFSVMPVEGSLNVPYLREQNPSDDAAAIAAKLKANFRAYRARHAQSFAASEIDLRADVINMLLEDEQDGLDVNLVRPVSFELITRRLRILGRAAEGIIEKLHAGESVASETITKYVKMWMMATQMVSPDGWNSSKVLFGVLELPSPTATATVPAEPTKTEEEGDVKIDEKKEALPAPTPASANQPASGLAAKDVKPDKLTIEVKRKDTDSTIASTDSNVSSTEEKIQASKEPINSSNKSFFQRLLGI